MGFDTLMLRLNSSANPLSNSVVEGSMRIEAFAKLLNGVLGSSQVVEPLIPAFSLVPSVHALASS